MRPHHFAAVTVLLLVCCSGVECVQDSGKKEEKALIEAFVNLQDVPQPFATKLAELKTQYDSGQLVELRQLTEELDKTYFKQETPDPSAIPYLIALIDADNSYNTVYGVGYFSLWRMTGVTYSSFHDGAFWKRWWERNKANFPEEFQKIAIPELSKTLHGKSYTPFPEKMETLDGLLEYLCSRFDPKNYTPGNFDGNIFLVEGEVHFQNMAFSFLGSDIARFNDPKAIPYLIGAIDADNSSATVSGLGHALRDLTGVKYTIFHDGAFWRRWWEKNKANYPEEVQNIAIPELPKTRIGKMYQPFPEDAETLIGQLLILQSTIQYVITLPEDQKGLAATTIWGVVQPIVEFNDPTAIPYFIAAIDADNTNATIYGVGYYGLAMGRPPLTDVKYDESHDGAWWKQWWEDNKQNYPQAVQDIMIPSIHDKWNIPDLSREVALWRQEKEDAEKRDREEQMQKELADSDVGNVPAELLHVDGNAQMEYFLIGVDSAKPIPESGYRLVIVMPGGDGSADFHPFIRRIWKYAMAESDFIIAQPIALRWTPGQQIVWPTEQVKVDKQEFSTEMFVESIVADVARRVKIDPNHVFTMSWSSSGPAAYAIALQEKTAITGSYIVMSVFKPDQLPPLENAKGRFFAIEHSPDDRVCPFRMAKDAETQLTANGATVRFSEYPGGHGWSGNVYGRIRNNLDWLQK